MVSGNIPTFKVYDSSEQRYYVDMSFYTYYGENQNLEWFNFGFINIAELINNNTSFDHNGSFENTATISSVFTDDIYEMGPNDILIGYADGEIRSAETAMLNTPNGGGYLFSSSIYLNETINSLSFKYYNYENKLIFNTSPSFSNVKINDSFGSATEPISLINEELLGFSLEQEFLNDFILINAYPNPFNPIIDIDLDIQNNDYLDITIIDINGSDVSKIFQGYKTPGKYIYKWDASEFSSGVYFIVIKNLKNKDYIFKKICLIK